MFPKLAKGDEGFLNFLGYILLILTTCGLPAVYLFDLGQVWYYVLGALFIVLNIFPSLTRKSTKRLTGLNDGNTLLIAFQIALIPDILLLIAAIILYHDDPARVWIFVAIAYTAELIVFWNGIIRVYILSKQLGIKRKFLGLLCGMIPVANLFVLHYILIVTRREAEEEDYKNKLNATRSEDEICKTRYPVLMVHGVFFRDFRFFNYWGRIPGELIRNGCTVYYGNQMSAQSVETCGAEIAAKIKEIIDTTGCEKVNVIAHSKGGLDTRYAISCLGMAPYVASLTTVNTPHRGCKFADYLLNQASESLKQSVAKKYNTALKLAGDKDPDFIKAVTDLTATRCEELNKIMPDSPEVYYQSVGSCAYHAVGGRFPLNFSYHLVKHFDGKNDGLVAQPSMVWGENFTFFEPVGYRGITHGDMIDLNRENVDGFDVREKYVEIVSGLKDKGF